MNHLTRIPPLPPFAGDDSDDYEDYFSDDSTDDGSPWGDVLLKQQFSIPLSSFHMYQTQDALNTRNAYVTNLSLPDSVLFRAVRMIDVMLSRAKIPDLKEYMNGCVSIASKIEMDSAPVKSAYEKDVLQILSFQCDFVTPYMFYQLFCEAGIVTNSMKDRVLNLLKQTLRDVRINKFLPSTIAAASAYHTNPQIQMDSYTSMEAVEDCLKETKFTDF